MPRVTICIPMYNHEDKIERCLQSVFDQTYKDYKVIIADDLSEDNSVQVAKRCLTGKPNCALIQHHEKQYFNNFPFLLDQADTDYVVLLAGDDYWAPTFLEATVKALDNAPQLVGCIPQCTQVYADGKVGPTIGTAPLKGDFISKLGKFIRQGLNNDRMYALFRTRLVKDCYPRQIMHAQDFAFTINTLARGDYEEIDEALIYREFTPLENYATCVKRDEPTALGRFLPFWSASKALYQAKIAPTSFAFLRKLIAINFLLHDRQVQLVYKKYGAVVSPLYRFIRQYVIWRL